MKHEIYLTSKEAQVIRHRAEIVDAMAQVFGPEGENQWGLEEISEVTKRVESILAEIVHERPSGEMILSIDVDDEDMVVVFADLIDGNTIGMIANDMLESADTAEQRRGIEWHKACNRIEMKVRSVTGMVVRFNR